MKPHKADVTPREIEAALAATAEIMQAIKG